MVEKFINLRKRVPILLGDPIETTIINTKTERSIFLLGKDNRRSGRRLRGLNKAFCKVFINEFLDTVTHKTIQVF